MKLQTDDDLAELFGETAQKVAEWRRSYGWPHIKVGRQVRYTDAHVERIVAQHEVSKKKADDKAALPGQTKRSANRSRS